MWRYVVENCDNAGVWTPNHKLAEFQIGGAIDWEKAAHALRKNLVVLENGKWWIPSFIAFQFGKLSPDAKVHQAVIRVLEAHGLMKRYEQFLADRPNQSHSNGIAIPSGKGKGKEEGQIAGPLEFPEWAGDAFREKFAKWQEFRRGLGKKPKDWHALFQEQLTWLGRFTERIASEILSQSMRNGWQGLFEVKASAKGAQPERQPKVDPAKVELPNTFRSWVTEARPELRDELGKWRTWADVPVGLKDEWWGDSKPAFLKNLA